MTQNQIAYQALLETQRANKAKEQENYRSNVSKETETMRSNLAKELENKVHNTNTEYLTLLDNLSDPIFSAAFAAGKLSDMVGGPNGRDYLPGNYNYNSSIPSIYSNSSTSSSNEASMGGGSARGR